jgi:hypothetical protein
MPKYCSNCGSPSADGARFCNSCGTPAANAQQAYTQPAGYGVAAAPAVQRMESTVIQVSPDYENDKIQEMEMFGWALQGRQEIHEEGDAYGRPSLIDSSTYVVKTKVSHYVKLHFVRSLALPNLTEAKNLEAQYFNLPFLKVPGLGWPIGFTAFGIFGLIIYLAVLNRPGSTAIGGVIFYAVWVALGLCWVKSRKKKRAAAEANNHASIARMQEIRGQVTSLLAA